MAEELKNGAADKKVAKKEKKSDKPAKKKEKKTRSVAQYFRELKGELKKVTWFSAQDTIKNSTWVVIALAILTVILGAVDWVFGTLIALIG